MAAGKQAIITQAAALFSSQGYDGTSMRQISQAAGVSLGLAYNYFPGKLELLRGVLAMGLEQLVARLADKPQSLHEFSRILIADLSAHRQFWLLVHGIRTQPPLAQEMDAEMRALEDELQGAVSAIIYRRIKDRREVETMAQVYLSLLYGASQSFLRNEQFPIEAVLQAFLGKALLY